MPDGRRSVLPRPNTYAVNLRRLRHRARSDSAVWSQSEPCSAHMFPTLFYRSKPCRSSSTLSHSVPPHRPLYIQTFSPNNLFCVALLFINVRPCGSARRDALLKRLFASPFWSDARHYQIAALSTLLIYNLGWLDFGARPLNSALAIGGALATQAFARACSRCRIRSALAADHRPVAQPAAARRRAVGACARRRHRHRLEIRAADRRQAHLESGRLRHRGAAVRARATCGFRPALGLDGVVRRAARLLRHPGAAAPRAAPTSRSSSSAPMRRCCWRARVWLGDPLAIPLHQLQSGSLLIFTFFMISDPRTSPDSRLGRFIFAASVALLAHYMAFFMQMRPALYVALIALSPFILLIDKILAGATVRLDAPGHAGSIPMTRKIASRLKATVAVAAIIAHSPRSPDRPPRSAASTSPRRIRSCSTSRPRWCWRATARPPPSRWRATTRASRRNSPSSSRCRPSSSASRSAWSR